MRQCKTHLLQTLNAAIINADNDVAEQEAATSSTSQTISPEVSEMVVIIRLL